MANKPLATLLGRFPCEVIAPEWYGAYTACLYLSFHRPYNRTARTLFGCNDKFFERYKLVGANGAKMYCDTFIEGQACWERWGGELFGFRTLISGRPVLLTDGRT